MEEGFKPEGSIKIYDASGRLVEQRSFVHQEELFNFYEKSGIYFIEVGAGKVISKKKIVILH
jgi:antitoxin component YwqK of YwqJK toxin-antitoxin module